MNTRDFLSVIIPSYNRCDALVQQLEWLAGQEVDRDRCEVIVVDDGSQDETWKLLESKARQLSWLRPFRQVNQGQAAARQYGVQKSRGDILLFLDDDMQPASSAFLERHRRFHATVGEPTVALGAILPPADDPPRPAFEYFYERSIQRLYQKFQEGSLRPSGVHFFSANVSLPKSLFLASGGFDSTFRHAEDRELGLRLEERGHAPFVFLREAAAFHHSRTGRYEAFIRRARVYGEYDLRIAQLYPQRTDLDPERMLKMGHPLKVFVALCAAKIPSIAQLATPGLVSLARTLQALNSRRLAVETCSILYTLHYGSAVAISRRADPARQQHRKRPPKPPGESLWYDVVEDLRMILAYEGKTFTLKHSVWGLTACDAYMVLLLFRLRMWMRRYKIPLVNRLLRFLQTSLYAIELGNEITLGHGVYFVHTVGTVVGGQAKIGDGCVFFGNNTVGASRFHGSPHVGSFTVIGAGARILGEISVGQDCFIGANAVVVDDIPDKRVAVGIPARILGDNDSSTHLQRMKSTHLQQVS